MRRVSMMILALILGAAAAGCAATGDVAAPASYDKPGFFTKVVDGRLWVLRQGSKELAQFQQHGEPAQMVTRIAAGPSGMTIRSSDAKTIDDYLSAK